MKDKALVGLLIATGVGAIIAVIGLSLPESANLVVFAIGFSVFMVASFLAGYKSSFLVRYFSLNNYNATGCISGLIYIFIYPLLFAVMVAVGWIFGLVKLFNPDNDEDV